MEEIAKAGILTGLSTMPILPGLCDDEANLEQVACWTASHCGWFVLASGLTLADQQRQFFIGVLRDRFPDLLPCTSGCIPPAPMAPSAAATRTPSAGASASCAGNMASPTGCRGRSSPATSGRTCGKRIVETLANQVYAMELDNAPGQRIWAYRKAAWAIEGLDQDVGLIYRQTGRRGLESIPNVGPRLALVVESLI